MSWDEWKQQRAHHLKKNARIAELESRNERQAEAIAAFTEQVRGLEKELQQEQGNNKALVIKNKFLRERPDLPVDRIPAYNRLKAELVEQARLVGMGAERELALLAECRRLRDAFTKYHQAACIRVGYADRILAKHELTAMYKQALEKET